MAIKVEINYIRQKNEVEVYANDLLIDFPYLQGKLIHEWFHEVTIGDLEWSGLLQELKDKINSQDISLEFISDTKSKELFHHCLVEQGVDVFDFDGAISISLDFDKIAQNNYETAIKCLDDNEDEARIYFALAAKYGHVQAQCELGKCYYYNIGGDLDEDEAIYWFKEAIAQGCEEAQKELSLIEKEQEDTDKYNREMLMLTEQFNSINGLNTAMLDLEE